MDSTPKARYDPKRAGRGCRVLVGLALIYLVAVAAVGVMDRLIAERAWWSTLLLYFPQAVYAAPAALLLPLALFRRDRRAALLTLGAVAVVAGPLAGSNVPLRGARASGRPVVRVMEYNVEGALEGFDGIARQVERFRPDVVVFPEARGWGREREMLGHLERLFPGWSHAAGGDVYVASRWPLAEREEDLLHPLLRRDPRLSQRRKVRMVVDAPFGRFQVIGVHFYTAVHGETLLRRRRSLPDYLRLTAAIRLEQARDTIDWTGQRSLPTIVAGDFNTPPAGEIYGMLTGSFRDSFAEAGWGWGFTFPSRFPLLRIDYVYHDGGWETRSCRVGESRGSDHRPMLAELVWRGAG